MLIEEINSFRVVKDELLSKEDFILNALVVVLDKESVNPSYKSSITFVLLEYLLHQQLIHASEAAVACCALLELLSKVDNPGSPQFHDS